MPFLDDIGVKGPKTRYNNKEVEPRLRRFVLEHLRNLDRVLYNLERTNLTVYGTKL